MSKYIRCSNCSATNFFDSHKCRRCGAKLKLDKSKLLQRSFAFFISALMFYIPANIYPVLQTSKFSNAQGSTIIGGMMELYDSGEYPVAFIIFIASVMIPILKFIIIFYLILSIKFKLYKNRRDKIKLYHMIEITGPWSLIDVFVVIILSSLIHFKTISVIPGIGATSFAIMVFFMMLSAFSLDVRLLGDESE